MKYMKKKFICSSVLSLVLGTFLIVFLNNSIVFATDVDENLLGPGISISNGAGNQTTTAYCMSTSLNVATGTDRYAKFELEADDFNANDFHHVSVTLTGPATYTETSNSAYGPKFVKFLTSGLQVGTYTATMNYYKTEGTTPTTLECPELIVVGNVNSVITDTNPADVFVTGGWTTIYALYGIKSGGYFTIPSPVPNVIGGASLGTIVIKYTTTSPVPPRIDLYLPKTGYNSFASREAAETWYTGTGLNTPINRVRYSKYVSTYWNRVVKGIGNPNNVSLSLTGNAPSTPGIYYFSMGAIVTGVDAGVRGGKAATGRYCVLGGGHCVGEVASCGTANGATLIAEPSGTAACPTGATRSDVTDSDNTYSWTCTAPNANVVNCSANKPAIPTIISPTATNITSSSVTL
jgi:hypothetical protein